jgi:hypothetical protein
MTDNDDERFDYLRKLASERRGWRLHDKASVFAHRFFDYRGRGQAEIWLQLQGRWCAGVDVTFDSPEDTTEGTLDVVEPWLDSWERVLELPLRLAECKTAGAARRMAADAPKRDLMRLANLFWLDVTAKQIVPALAQQFGPSKRRFWG